VRQVLWNKIKIQGLVVLEHAFSPGICGILTHDPVYRIITEKGFCWEDILFIEGVAGVDIPVAEAVAEVDSKEVVEEDILVVAVVGHIAVHRALQAGV
jgi:hypothetical protein